MHHFTPDTSRWFFEIISLQFYIEHALCMHVLCVLIGLSYRDIEDRIENDVNTVVCCK